MRGAGVVTGVLLALTPLTTGCGSDEPYPHPTGADEIVLDIAVGGGMTTERPAVYFQPFSRVRVLGDGTVLLPDPDDPATDLAAETRPVLPSFLRTTITEAEVQELLDLADDAGLLDPDLDLEPRDSITDAGSVVVRVATDEELRHSAYALDLVPDDTGERERLSGFLVDVDALVAVAVADAADVTPYRPTRLQLGVVPGASQNPVRWPAGAPRLTASDDCQVLDLGADDAGVVDLLRRLDTEGTVQQGEEEFRLEAAPLLPGDDGCRE